MEKRLNQRFAIAPRAGRAVLAAGMILAASLAARAQSSGEAARAEEIVRKCEDNQVYETAISRIRLVVENRLGKTESEFTAYSRKGGDALVVVEAGPDRGQKVLRQKKNVYLYFPEAEEVVWLKGSALRDSMMGSDFSYEDLTDDGTILDRYSVEYLGTEEFDGAVCVRVMLVARTREETYARQELWIDERLYVARKAILYSAAGKPLRELISSDIRQVGGKNVPFRSVMRDLLKKNSKTEMIVLSMKIGVPIEARYFNREELSW